MMTTYGLLLVSTCCDAPVSGQTYAFVNGQEMKRFTCDCCLGPCKIQLEKNPWVNPSAALRDHKIKRLIAMAQPRGERS